MAKIPAGVVNFLKQLPEKDIAKVCNSLKIAENKTFKDVLSNKMKIRLLALSVMFALSLTACGSSVIAADTFSDIKMKAYTGSVSIEGIAKTTNYEVTYEFPNDHTAKKMIKKTVVDVIDGESTTSSEVEYNKFKLKSSAGDKVLVLVGDGADDEKLVISSSGDKITADLLGKETVFDSKNDQKQEASASAETTESTSSSSTSLSNSSSSSSKRYSSSKSSVGSKKVKCTVCNGTGSVRYNYGDSDLQAILDGHDPYTYGKCSACNGTGYSGYTQKAGTKGCGSCGKTVSSLSTRKDAAGVSRTWCSSCWASYNSIMGN